MFDLAQISYWMPFLTQPSLGRGTALRVHKLVTPEAGSNKIQTSAL